MIDMCRDIGMRVITENTDAGKIRFGALAFERDVELDPRQLCAAFHQMHPVARVLRLNDRNSFYCDQLACERRLPDVRQPRAFLEKDGKRGVLQTATPGTIRF